MPRLGIWRGLHHQADGVSRRRATTGSRAEHRPAVRSPRCWPRPHGRQRRLARSGYLPTHAARTSSVRVATAFKGGTPPRVPAEDLGASRPRGGHVWGEEAESIGRKARVERQATSNPRVGSLSSTFQRFERAVREADLRRRRDADIEANEACRSSGPKPTLRRAGSE